MPPLTRQGGQRLGQAGRGPGGGSAVALPGGLQRQGGRQDLCQEVFGRRSREPDLPAPGAAARRAAARPQHPRRARVHRRADGPDPGPRGELMRYRVLAVLPLAWGAVYLVVALALLGHPALGTFLRTEITLVKLLAVAGAWAA